MLALTEPGHLQIAASPGVHKGKLSCAELFTELPLHKIHLDGSQLSPVELRTQITICKSTWQSLDVYSFFSSIALIRCLYLLLHLPH